MARRGQKCRRHGDYQADSGRQLMHCDRPLVIRWPRCAFSGRLSAGSSQENRPAVPDDLHQLAALNAVIDTNLSRIKQKPTTNAGHCGSPKMAGKLAQTGHLN